MASPVPEIGPSHETMKLSTLLPANNDLLDLALPVHKGLDGMVYPAVLDIDIDIENRPDTGMFCHRHLFEPSRCTIAENVVEACNDGMKNKSAQDLNKSKEEEKSQAKATA